MSLRRFCAIADEGLLGFGGRSYVVSHRRELDFWKDVGEGLRAKLRVLSWSPEG